MRSRPTVEVHSLPPVPVAGQRVRFETTLIGHSRTPIDRVSFRFIGRERRQLKGGKYPTFASHIHFSVHEETAAMVLEAGQRVELPTGFRLPVDLPPPYSSDVARIEYVFEVRVDIPWWPDRTAQFLVPVWPAWPPPPKRAAVFLATGARASGPHLELTVAGGACTLGGEVTGAISADHFKGNSVRQLEVALKAVESSIAASSLGDRTFFRSIPVVVEPRTPRPGVAYPFTLKLPTDEVPSFTSELIRVRWYLEARAVVLFGRDAVLRTKLEVGVPGKAGNGSAEVPAGRVAPLGNERRALIWATVAQRTGLTADAEGETMTCAVGPIRLTVLLEVGDDGNVAAAAQLAWPSLGLDLAIAERRWKHLLSGSTPLGDKAFDKRFAVRCRDVAQVRALLDPDVRAALQQLDRLALDDEGAEVGASEPGVTLESLEGFVRAAIAAADALNAAFSGVPPPASLAAHVPAWRAFARRLGGTFQPGGFSIHAADHKGAPVALVTAFDADGRPEATLVRALLSGPKGPTPEATRAMASLSRECEGLRLADDAVEARLPCPLADPARAEPLWKALARVVKALG